MPEGDSIYKLAARLRPTLVGRPVRLAMRGRAVRRWREGVTVSAVTTHGKNTLVHFDDGGVLRIHLGLSGRMGPGDHLPPRGHAVLLATSEASWVCRDAAAIELMGESDLASHPVMSTLGPDLLVDPLPLDTIVVRARGVDADIATTLLDQRVAAGIGNVYKCETLFLERLDPWTPQRALDDARIAACFDRAATLLRANLGPGRRVTTGAPAPGKPTTWVYERGRRPCLRCRTPIRARRQGAELPRWTWWCPRCQPPQHNTDG